jgi:TetR/AcrR family transcriptional repressor of mexJK operon
MTAIGPTAAHPAIRRRGGERRAALIDAARELFLACGYEGTQMQDVALKAGSSKETLYRHFPDKSALFASVIDAIADRLSTPVTLAADGGSVQKILESFGESLLQGLLQSAEAGRFPELGRFFNQAGPATVKARLADYLRTETANGALNCGDPSHAAALLLGSLIADLQLRALLGQELGSSDLHQHVAEAVAMFLTRYGRI